ncbi:MAG: tRNA uracil 4-sulfurtransferase ThiI [Christensenellales bacterium]|jgi:thiamine biosynthesis protein ThiI
MRQVLLVRFGEVYLKGQNRPFFLKRLTENVRRAVAPIGGTAWLSDSRIYVADCDIQSAISRVKKVFGIHSVSPAWELDKDFDKICEVSAEIMRGKTGTFKVFARRSDKAFPVDSMEMGKLIGGYVLQRVPGLSVDVHAPQHKLSVEVRDRAYIYVEEIRAAGGMPTGTAGKALLLLSGGIDSPVAGYQVMRRGVVLQAIHYFSFPYTSDRAKQKVFDLAKILSEYQSGMLVHVVPFTRIQLEIHEKCADSMGTILMRRFMMRIAERVAQENGLQALVTGESIGQVASQTMEALMCTDALARRPVFRPLIGLDKLEITEIAEKIDTYNTSILPYEDCCTVFTPRHPTTKPKIEDVEREEAKLDVGALVDEAVRGIEQYRTWEEV